jgi:hypothetical protein
MTKARDVIKELVARAAADLAKIEVLQAAVAKKNAKSWIQEGMLEMQRSKIQELHWKVAELQHRLQNEPPPPSS